MIVRSLSNIKSVKRSKIYSHPELKDIALSDILHALSDPCRINIVRAIAGSKTGELSCNEIPLNLSKATRSHHFSVLREAGVIFTRVEGTRSMTCLRKDAVKK